MLGRSLDTDRLEASYHDGVLTVSIPVAEKARARKIPVQRADAPMPVERRTIEGDSGEPRRPWRPDAMTAAGPGPTGAGPGRRPGEGAP